MQCIYLVVITNYLNQDVICLMKFLKFYNGGTNIQSIQGDGKIFKAFNTKPLHFKASDSLWTVGTG